MGKEARQTRWYNKKTLADLAQTQRDASSRWYYKNYEYRCSQKKKYYEENRDRILEQRKQKQKEIDTP